MSHPQHTSYTNPLISRYASKEMSYIWSAQKKHSTWRRLWVALAESEKELGIEQISDAQIQQLKDSVDEINFEVAAKHEKNLRHDVMAHVHTYGDCCPDARSIIHLGATSCFVTDNTELIQMRESLELIRTRLVSALDQMSHFAYNMRDLPCLGFTHLQPAQPTTIGKRAALWCHDLVLDLEEIEHRLEQFQFRGVKGTTGTQGSFLSLFGGDHGKVEALDQLVQEKMGFQHSFPVTGQTYSRKIDSLVQNVLNGIAQSASKAGTDIRILQHRKEVEEPFEKNQIGSSAMAYKRNPMRSERMCGLARFVISLSANTDHTAANQWLERTLDDSANRRLSVPQSFLATDAILILYRNISDGLVVYPKVIEKNVNEELPFMATEEILMAACEAGGDRQDLHERIRVHSLESAKEVKEKGKQNDLIDRLKDDPAFAKVDFSQTMDARQYIGRSSEQVHTFIHDVIRPIREKYRDAIVKSAEEVWV